MNLDLPVSAPLTRAASGWIAFFVIVCALGLLCLGAFGGAHWVGAEKDAEIADIRKEAAEAESAVEVQNRLRLEAAKQRNDALEMRLAETERARTQLQQEKTREIARLTTGTPCLGAGLVGLLNAGSKNSRPGLSQAIGRAAAADAAAATDTDVALWIDNAQRQYDTCRDRLQALIDWHAAPEAGND